MNWMNADTLSPQTIAMAPDLLPGCQDGSKTFTVRRGVRPYRLGPTVLDAGTESVTVEVIAIEVMPLADFEDMVPGYTAEALKPHYPDIDWSEDITLVRWTPLN